MFAITRMTKKNFDHLMAQLGPTSRLLIGAAFRLGYTVDSYGYLSVCRVSKKNKSILMRGGCLPLNSYSAAKIADNKYLTHSLFELEGIPTPHSIHLERSEGHHQGFDLSGVHYPVVLKPSKGTIKGNGVITNISNATQLKQYIKTAFRRYNTLLVEEYYGGLQDYRVLVLDGKVIGVLKRIPAYVVGDGVHTLRQLIRKKNAIRKQSLDIVMGSIKIDDDLLQTLIQKKLTFASIPKKGAHIQLKNVCNFGSGGEVEDVTERICKENIDMAVRAAKALDLRLVGLDFLCTDIAKPIKKTRGVVLEANEEPDLTMHYYPPEGKKRKIAEQIVHAMFT